MAPGSAASAGRRSARLRQGLLGAAGTVLLFSTLTVGSSPAAAVDINGLVNAAIAISAHYARLPASRQGSNAAAKRDRDSDDEDEDSGSRNRKSAGTPSPQHRPASTQRKSMEAAAGDPAESMVSLDRSLDNGTR